MNTTLCLLVSLGALLLPLSLQAQVPDAKADSLFRVHKGKLDSAHHDGLVVSIEKWASISGNLKTSKDQQRAIEGIDRHIATFYSVQDNIGLTRYLDSVLFHLDLPEAKCLELQLRQSISLREARDLDRAISVGHAVLSGAQAGQFTRLESQAIANLAGCYGYAGLYEKSEKWRERALAFARQHGFTRQIIRGLNPLGYQLMNAGDYAGSRAAFEEILSLIKNDTLGNSYAHAKGGLLNSYIFEDNLHSDEVSKLLQEVKTLSERAKPFPSAHGRRDLLGILCNYYNKVGQPQIALRYAREHVAHVRKFSPDTSEIVRFALGELYPVEASADDYEAAYQTLLRLREVDEVMSKRSQTDELAEASIKLDVYNHEVARQAAEQTAQLEQQAKNDRTRLLLIISLLAAFIISGTLYAYRRLYRDRQLIGQQNAIVTQALSEKEVLLREIHHRVKNNLQIISSLLQSQADLVDNREISQLMAEGQERIHSMALIHQHLYQSKDLGGVNIKSYLGELTDNIQRSHSGVTSPIELNLEVADEHLDIDTAIPVGLILNELITNAYKYAFPDGKAGKIIVEFRKASEHFYLRVSDNGVGLPTDHDLRKSNRLGINLVNGLVRQLDGQIAWEQQGPGMAVAIEF